jgi:hypothetical protein
VAEGVLITSIRVMWIGDGLRQRRTLQGKNKGKEY